MANSNHETPQITVSTEINDFGELVHHFCVGNRDIGILDWDSDIEGNHGYVDGLDPSVEAVIACKKLRKVAWPVIAQCMHELHPEVQSVQIPRGDIILVGQV